ncbi:hypothetical protein NDU88_002028 [Pleurodeles waltl]|uniref:Uncharacterized protein n=1 Tax=Pleurodeles waltl TaxID=8319 RepID=A0AAV7QBS0_PLEWA|nr:hypothetical protein NDU88_002028 [Pleurodeles waltl]
MGVANAATSSVVRNESAMRARGAADHEISLLNRSPFLYGIPPFRCSALEQPGVQPNYNWRTEGQRRVYVGISDMTRPLSLKEPPELREVTRVVALKREAHRPRWGVALWRELTGD